jgi:hypothetical protein
MPDQKNHHIGQPSLKTRIITTRPTVYNASSLNIQERNFVPVITFSTGITHRYKSQFTFHILSLGLYGYKIWSLTLKLKNISRPKVNKVWI